MRPAWPRHHLTTQPDRRNQEPQWNTQGIEAHSSTAPKNQKQNQNEITIPSTVDRWIQAKRDGDTHPVLPRAHRAISNFKSWLRGTHRGVSAEHLQVYLDEFIFRYNRRRTPMAAFQTLLGLSSQHPPSTRAEIVAEGPAAAKTKLS